MSGGAGPDRFIFVRGDTGRTAASADLITDFQHRDHIDLSAFDAMPRTKAIDAFQFIGTKAFSGAVGELRYEVAGGETAISGDINGDKVADFLIRLTGNFTLISDDFLFAAASPGGGLLFLAHADITANHLIELA